MRLKMEKNQKKISHFATQISRFED